MNKSRIGRIYNNLVKDVEDTLGSGSTTDSDLADFGHSVIGQQFSGVYASDTVPSELSQGTHYFIVNRDRDGQPGSHWVGVVVKRGRLYYYDSFGRPMAQLMPSLTTFRRNGGLIATNPNERSAPEQSVKEMNCGSRSMAWLILFHRLGAGAAKVISM